MGDEPMGDDVTRALAELGEFVARLHGEDVPGPVWDRLELVTLDHVVVTIAGATTPEGRALVDATDPPAGPAPVLGARRTTTVDVAAWLNGTACCALELDEGNKYARGHPAAHAFPAALAHAASTRGPVSGQGLALALLAGYEVGARIGAATHLHPGVHPHGNAGVLGAAAAVCRIAGDGGDLVADALDAAGALVLATPFATVLAGNAVRNTWVGHANVAGLQARRVAAAGLAGAGGTVEHTLGGLLGQFDPAVATAGLGNGFAITDGYFKRHACCSYTHPPADAVLLVRDEIDPDQVDRIRVETHHLAAGLSSLRTDTRLGAMFSIPYVVAVALRHGDCAPRRFDAAHRRDPVLGRLGAAVIVERTDAMDARLPAERAARVTIGLASGREVTADMPNPVGDADHHPFTRAEVEAKADALLTPHGVDVDQLATAVHDLLTVPDIATVLPRLP